MWSPDLRLSRRLLVLGLATVVAGCGEVRPLYAPGGGVAGAPGPQVELSRVYVVTPTTRAGMKVRNELIFGFNGGVDPAQPAYRLVVRVTDGSVPIGTEQYQNLPSSTLVQMNASFQLVESATGRVLFKGTSFANAAYDYSSQRFANARAKLNAEDRAAGVIATDIRTKLTAWFVSAKRSPAVAAGATPAAQTAFEQTIDDNSDD
jgi:LPS-assembly lipoprotein